MGDDGIAVTTLHCNMFISIISTEEFPSGFDHIVISISRYRVPSNVVYNPRPRSGPATCKNPVTNIDKNFYDLLH